MLHEVDVFSEKAGHSVKKETVTVEEAQNFLLAAIDNAGNSLSKLNKGLTKDQVWATFMKAVESYNDDTTLIDPQLWNNMQREFRNPKEAIPAPQSNPKADNPTGRKPRWLK